MAASRKAKYTLWSIVVLVPVALAWLLIPNATPDVKVLDPLLHVDDCRVAVGTHHSSDRNKFARLVSDVLHKLHIQRGVALPEVTASRSTNFAALVFRYRYNGPRMPTLYAEVTDASGTTYRLRLADMAAIGRPNAGSEGAAIWGWYDRPPGSGRYEFRIREVRGENLDAANLPVGTVGPVVATFTTWLEEK